MTNMQTPYLKLYIAVLDAVPDHMVPVLVAHSMLGAHLKFETNHIYREWLMNSFRKCVVSVNTKEFSNLFSSQMSHNYCGHENKTLDGDISCIIPLPVWSDKVPNTLKFAKLWKPKPLEIPNATFLSTIGDEGGHYKR